MGVKIITENGAEIELTPEIIAESDPKKVESFVADQRRKLNLPAKPPKSAKPEE